MQRSRRAREGETDNSTADCVYLYTDTTCIGSMLYFATVSMKAFPCARGHFWVKLVKYVWMMEMTGPACLSMSAGHCHLEIRFVRRSFHPQCVVVGYSCTTAEKDDLANGGAGIRVMIPHSNVDVAHETRVTLKSKARHYVVA